MKQRSQEFTKPIWPKAKQREENRKRASHAESSETHWRPKVQAHPSTRQPKAVGGRHHPGAAAPGGRPTLGGDHPAPASRCQLLQCPGGSFGGGFQNIPPEPTICSYKRRGEAHTLTHTTFWSSLSLPHSFALAS